MTPNEKDQKNKSRPSFAGYVGTEPMYRLKHAGPRVSGHIVHAAGHPIPLTPDQRTYQRMIAWKQRCGNCWRALKGNDDLAWHKRTSPMCKAWYWSICGT